MNSIFEDLLNAHKGEEIISLLMELGNHIQGNILCDGGDFVNDFNRLCQLYNLMGLQIVSTEIDANGVTAENLSSFHGRSDCTFVVANKGQTDERKDSLKTFIDKLPSRDEGKNLTHTEKFDNAFIEYDNISIKVRAIKFVYDVHFSYDQQHIDAMNLAKAVVNNVITGRSFLINIRNDVSELK